MARKPNITISYEDLRDIEDQLSKIKLPSERYDELEKELIRAKVVNQKDLAPDVVAIGSQVTFKISKFDKHLTKTLCLPLDMNKYDDGISIFAPIGSALLGLRAGQKIRWNTQSGEQHIDILEVKRKVRYLVCE
ncbi:GreA/GreB family elongation factor [Aestuariibacter sp. A3R04]|uniref:GreA/GreB family elongation factor n=1 Tax=Aestuariibacter sp. A3R04 TaxID=2841571 RepID=UPI001C096B4D|nr:GreA/GreB family elongation factor [Aestuariibacter sp. A3R04]MBU3021394.1 GreA/GreB family elongation factor [Aestuariibacter sp. A3R04]